LGSLSLSIVKKGAKLIAIEIDKRLADRLPKTLIEHGVDQESFTVIAKDAMEVERAELTGLGGASRPLKLVANLPYNVSVPVLLHFLEMEIFADALVMVQSEVAQRLAASPGSREYGVPSAKVAWYADARLSDSIPRAVFWPIPRIDSSLLRLTMHRPLENEALRRFTFAIIDAAFNQRRKMLRSSLSPLIKELVPGSSSDQVLESCGIDPTSRAESLSVEQFLEIAGAIETMRNSL
ncbi:MAG: 16S rRNA (adenine(1518)-N(6)/adenine(1519)-N(6))-dimethyltransferase RsmA, partial [Candidatus Nanopelagicaceae bacterium]